MTTEDAVAPKKQKKLNQKNIRGVLNALLF
jgi:hypothetical protein